MKKVEYSENGRLAFFDNYKFRLDLKTGYYLSTKPTDIGRRERLHCYVWRRHNGQIPRGYHVHHVNEDKHDNNIENLRCIPGTLHTKHHSCEHAISKYDEVCKNLIENALPKASEWHKSPEGREWHKKNSVIPHTQIEKVCEHCGRIYLTIDHGNNKFCSNGCKAATRRKSGVDDETKVCTICGKEFTANKYSTVRCCSRECSLALCRHQKHQTIRQRAGL